MDRNLGASHVATGISDVASYGDLYQWGRFADGHQCRTSIANTVNATNDTPGHTEFIQETVAPNDWRAPQNDLLWQGINGVNNPCPFGYRIPTDAELNAERNSWTTNSSIGSIGSPLKLPTAGLRNFGTGNFHNVGWSGYYWSSTVNSTNSLNLAIYAGNSIIHDNERAYGFSVRCIKE